MWGWAAAGFLLSVLPALYPLLRGRFPDRVVAAQFIAGPFTLCLVCIAQAHGHDYLLDVALAQAIAGLGGGLMLMHAMERWL